MREIKFRAWWIKDDGEEIGNPMMLDMNDILNYVDPRIPVKNGDIILMQYTGVKDKFGKEIYEGDILQAPCKEDRPYKCIYDETRCAFIAVTKLEDKTDWCLGIFNDNYFEVIGNIYENSELLEKYPWLIKFKK